METESDSLLDYGAGREWEEPPCWMIPEGGKTTGRTREQKKKVPVPYHYE